MVAIALVTLLSVYSTALAFPSNRQQNFVRIVAPPRPTNTGIASIPAPQYPYIAPGPNDIRGPCPGLNVLANHGYLPRSGVASFEQVINAVTQGFNMDYDFASGLVAFSILSRGNAFINKISIGLESPNVPPLPDQIDGPSARGMGAHGRLKGDVSMTRQDASIGDNVKFNQDLFDQILDYTAQYGDDSAVTGPKSIVNVRVFQEVKYRRFLDNQAADKALQYHLGRYLLSYGEAGFALNFFANGTDGALSVPTMTTFFRDERFPASWHRRPNPATSAIISASGLTVAGGHPLPPGANNATGSYIPEAVTINECSLYDSMVQANLPAVLLNTTGLLRENVDFLLGVIHDVFPDCPLTLPGGAANV